MICKGLHKVIDFVRLSSFSFLVGDTEECVAFVLGEIARIGMYCVKRWWWPFRGRAEQDSCNQMWTYVRSWIVGRLSGGLCNYISRFSVMSYLQPYFSSFILRHQLSGRFIAGQRTSSFEGLFPVLLINHAPRTLKGDVIMPRRNLFVGNKLLCFWPKLQCSSLLRLMGIS